MAAHQWQDFGANIEASLSPSAFGNASMENVNVYPNPVTDAFRIDGLEDVSTLSLIDVSGRILLQKQVSDNETVSVSTLPKGVYVLKVSNNNGVSERKIVKQ